MNLETKIMVFGTFEIVHPGHLDFFKQARKLAKNPRLIVSVSRDANAERIKNKKLAVTESARIRQVRKTAGVDRAVLGGKVDYFSHIFKEKPDIIALGYDQTAYVKELRRDLKKTGLKTKIVRLRAYLPRVFKTSLIKRNMVKFKQLSGKNKKST